MRRYLICLFNKILRLLKFLITKLIYNLLILKYWNYRLIIIYIILVSFSTIILIYNQSNSNIIRNLLSKSSIDNSEIIHVNKKLTFLYLMNKYYFSVIFLNYH